jgi:hypothetical protein
MQKWLKIACKMGLLLEWKISMSDAPKGYVLVNFFQKTFRISHWYLVEQIKILKNGFGAI